MNMSEKSAVLNFPTAQKTRRHTRRPNRAELYRPNPAGIPVRIKCLALVCSRSGTQTLMKTGSLGGSGGLSSRSIRYSFHYAPSVFARPTSADANPTA